ncbi:MAG TPA: START domain-containing protein [Bacteroidia bacterium]|nr:START domain-containing protein [Bacteroidia bacterium]
MFKTIILSFFYSFISFFGFSQSDVTSWALKKNEKGIEVYTRKAANSNFKELKAIFLVKASLGNIVALVDDWANYSNWVYKCGQSAILKKVSETELIHYQTVLVPWPLDKRDFIVTTVITQDEKTKIVTIKSTANPNYIPVNANFIRIPQLDALWTLTPLKDGTTQVTYQLLVNPGGCIPVWIVNMVVVDGPFETMVNFKTWVMKPKYQAAKVSFIKEAD